MATFGQLQIEAQRIIGRPYMQRPHLFFLPEPAFSQMACNKAPAHCRVAGVAFANGLIVININEVDPDTVAGQAIIVHELVHVTQTFTIGLQPCLDSEQEAYAVAAQWAKEKGGSTWTPNSAEILLRCMEATRPR